MNTLFLVNAQQKGFFASLAKKFHAEGHSVAIMEVLPGAADYYRKHLKIPEPIAIYDALDVVPPPESDTIDIVKDYEKKYDVEFAFLVSQHRGLGRGYLLNADRYPRRGDAWLTHEAKLRSILVEFMRLEALAEIEQPDMIVQVFLGPVVSAFVRSRGIVGASVGIARCSNRCMIYNSSHLESTILDESIDNNLAAPERLANFDPPTLQRDAVATKTHASDAWTYPKALRRSIPILRNGAIQTIRSLLTPARNDGYPPFAWLPSVFRRARNYRYVCKHGISPEALSARQIVYFPLHLEPEAALTSVSPEYNNSLEAICSISKALPADHILVVREHTLSFGVRSKTFYDFLRQIGNVELAHPAVHAWKWIEESSFVATISGTAGFEGVHFRKPVLSFGQHQVINKLPTVALCTDFQSVRSAIKSILKWRSNAELLEHSHKVLACSLFDSSFELPGYVDSYGKSDPMPEAADVCFERLMANYVRARPNRDTL